MERFLYKRLDKKDPKINLWFSFPSIENFAMSSLGYLSIFKDLDLNPDIYAERVCFDTKNTLINPRDVDCMGFSVCFELDILNIIKMLKKYDFPLKAKNRKEEDPIIFAGGAVMTANPVPYEEFFDFVSIGEKVSLNQAMGILKDKNKYKRDEILEKLSEIEGIYVPKYPKEKIQIARDDMKDPLYTPILSDNSYFKDTFIIEVERGCPKMCRFCLASWMNLPARFIEYEKIIEAIDLGFKYTNKIALLGAYVAGHPRFEDIIDYISNLDGVELSVSSLRADLASEKLIKTLVKCGQKTATIALEAGSQRLRDLINKDLSKEQIENTILNMKKFGLRGAKIYAMIGLPTETKEDLDELISLVQSLKSKTKGAFTYTLSFSTFIPKAQTPFEFVEREDKKTLEEKIKYLKKNLNKMGVQTRFSSVDWDDVQAILSRYDESMADFLIEVSEEGGNLGAFKKVWRSYYKNEKGISADLHGFAKIPLNNIKTPKWTFINSCAHNLKLKHYEQICHLVSTSAD